jgi:cyclic pyranopterin phosphate synthase
MPEADYVWLPRESILTFEETATIVDAFTSTGVDRVRITGGEPLLRRNLPELIEQLASMPAIVDLSLTTNGVLLSDQAAALRAAGLHRITVSLDTLNGERFRKLGAVRRARGRPGWNRRGVARRVHVAQNRHGRPSATQRRRAGSG